ncbi:MAG TPA: PilZ domain-containing protein [Planctomycetota bacterium]|nr:PilZ domain-containing protein [Planctomycetota bacterium]
MKERRSTDRIPDDFPGLLTRSLHDADIHAVRIRDLADGGACALADFEPTVGTEYYAGFFLAGSGGIPLIARVQVVWTRREFDEYAIGFEFLYEGQAQLDSVIRIRDYLAARRREMVGASG